MKLPTILFGRRADPSTAPLSPAAEVERVENEITRLLQEAVNARAEAERIAVSDPTEAVTLDSAADQAEQLVARLRASLPDLYRRRRAEALKVREAEIDKAVELEQAALRELAERIRDLSIQAMRAITELRSLGVGQVMGSVPVALHGGRIMKYLLPDEKMTPDALGKRIDQDLSARLEKIAHAGELLKYATRNDRDVVTGDIESIALTNTLRGRFTPFEAPRRLPKWTRKPLPPWRDERTVNE